MLMKGTAEPHLGFAAWLSKAAITYPLCGAIAGLVSAAAWFRFRKSEVRGTPETTGPDLPDKRAL
jgi:hypothetical protein